MATTRIIPMHVNKGKTIAQCLTERTDYAKNPDKTEDGEYISAYACDAKTADSEFLLSKRQYRQLTGREQASDVIAYQIRQSFKPGEVTPEEANRLGYEFARRFTKGDHAFIVCTHTDKSTFITILFGTPPRWTARENSATSGEALRPSESSVILSVWSTGCL